MDQLVVDLTYYLSTNDIGACARGFMIVVFFAGIVFIPELFKEK